MSTFVGNSILYNTLVVMHFSLCVVNLTFDRFVVLSFLGTCH